MDRGVTCTSCGASTPLPANLLVPTFGCAFCKAELQTAAYAGQHAVSADAFVAHVRAVVASPSSTRGEAPRFHNQSTETRPGTCLSCKAPIGIPLDLTVKQIRCGSCGHEQAVEAHVSNEQRFAADMQRQVAGNEALKALQAAGVVCTKCGGRNEVPGGGTVQVPCRFCGAVILLSDHVDASAIARARLKQGVHGMLGAEKARVAREQKIVLVILAVVFGLVGIGALVSFLFPR